MDSCIKKMCIVSWMPFLVQTNSRERKYLTNIKRLHFKSSLDFVGVSIFGFFRLLSSIPPRLKVEPPPLCLGGARPRRYWHVRIARSFSRYNFHISPRSWMSVQLFGVSLDVELTRAAARDTARWSGVTAVCFRRCVRRRGSPTWDSRRLFLLSARSARWWSGFL